MRNNPWIPSSLPSFLSSSIYSFSSFFFSFTHSLLSVCSPQQHLLEAASGTPLPSAAASTASSQKGKSWQLWSACPVLTPCPQIRSEGRDRKPDGAWRSCKACSFLGPLLCDHPPQPLVPAGRSPDYRFFPCSPSCPDAPCVSSLPKRHHHHPIFHGHFLPQPNLQSVSRPFQVCHLWVF